FQRRFLGIEPLERRRGVGRQRPLAFEIGGELFESAIEFADTFLGARLFTFERFAGDDEPLQRGRGSGLALAQRRKPGGKLGLPCRSLSLYADAGGNDADGLVLRAL